MQALAMCFTITAGFGFHQAFGWNLVQIVFAMGAMVPLAVFITEKRCVL